MDNETNSIAVGQLRSIVERVERLEDEKAAISTDIKEVFAEAKANGYDTQAIKEILKMRKKDPSERMEQEHIVQLYLDALGMA